MNNTLVIANHSGCNLLCEHCMGRIEGSSGPRPFTQETPARITQQITTPELHGIIADLLSRGQINPDLYGINFGGRWCEPTLDPTLPEKINFLLNVTQEASPNCEICVITNGIQIPSENYDEEAMSKYMLQNFGFEEFPKRFFLCVSLDEEHYSSYVQRRLFEESSLSPETIKSEYDTKMQNIARYVTEKGYLDQFAFNIVVPMGVPESDYIEEIKKKFGIPENIRIDVLKRSIYTSAQHGLENAQDLTRTHNTPSDQQECFFLAKRRDNLVIYPDIVSFGYDQNAIPFEEFQFS